MWDCHLTLQSLNTSCPGRLKTSGSVSAVPNLFHCIGDGFYCGKRTEAPSSQENSVVPLCLCASVPLCLCASVPLCETFLALAPKHQASVRMTFRARRSATPPPAGYPCPAIGKRIAALRRRLDIGLRG